VGRNNKMKFIVATKNKNKLSEIKDILKDFPFDVVSMEEVGIGDEIEENADTFEGNALLKAKAIHSKTGGYVMADDSGLCIDALGGAPGIYSARFAGENTDYQTKINKIWEMMKQSGSNSKDARFVCAIAVIDPDGKEYILRGECEGVICDKIQGNNGFGYDPVFLIPHLGKTTAQLSPEDKNKISHRGRALAKMVEMLKNEI